ncbi:MAG: 3' terminal RNA ribose 2'-O-methyltransferase Hen1 [Treponema sp.]|jgi:3' terminal RNA ribose 2'-O-methyltransferase Hen1|nr:3' terminal RNA ribose 2'-O-methyltransferase Hen1 [Treponema sp.]
MILTITYTGQNTTELGYLLYKNPYRPQKFELNCGYAYVFYPEVSNERTTAALLLDIDPINLARGKTDVNRSGLFDYVNDRPYVSSSFLSTAISNVFGTAMTGRADNHQTLSDSPLDLTANIAMLPCRGDTAMLNRVFEPLGYAVSHEAFVTDEKFPVWSKIKYVNLTIRGKARLRDLLKHIYVLVPVFDRQKHYWVGEDEVDKLLQHGEDWLPNHPEKGYITSRYLKHLRPLVNMAFARLVAADAEADADLPADSAPDDETPKETPERKLNLNAQRLGSMIAALKSCGAKSVIDIGCGEGNLLSLLVRDGQFVRIAGTDVSHVALERASERLKLDKGSKENQVSDSARERLTLFQSSLMYKDSRFKGYDAACVIEVIEHLDPSRLAAFERILFEYTKNPVVILTTPNREYNVKYENIDETGMRHGDHRFEWTRAEFREWAVKTAGKYGYEVRFSEIGEHDEALGAPTQMGVFVLCG